MTDTSKPATARMDTDSKPRTGRKMGRPSNYTPELGQKIAQAVVKAGGNVKKACRDDKTLPRDKSFYDRIWKWSFEDAGGEFRQILADARIEGMQKAADEMLDIADNGSEDHHITASGKVLILHENINRSRLRVDTRKWLLSKLISSVYGDRLEHTGQGGGPIEITSVSYAGAAKLIDGERVE